MGETGAGAESVGETGAGAESVGETGAEGEGETLIIATIVLSTQI